MSHTRSEQEKQRRRSIVKGVAGVPLIFTLPNGTALAAASLSCKDKSHALAQTEPYKGGLVGSPSITDKWVRFKIQAYSIKQQSNSFVTGFTLNNLWYSVNLSNGAVNQVTPLGNGNAPTVLAGQFCYLIVDYDKYSSSASPETYIFLGTDTPSAPIAGSSCWNSLSGTTASADNLIN